MFKLCVFVALLSLVAAAPAPAPVPAPAPSPSLIGHPGLLAPGLWGPTIIGSPLVHSPLIASPHLVSVVPGAVSHIAISQAHPSPVLVKHLW